MDKVQRFDIPNYDLNQLIKSDDGLLIEYVDVFKSDLDELRGNHNERI